MNKAIVIWDNLISQNEEFCNRIKDIDSFYNYDIPEYTKIKTKNLSQTLEDLHKQNYKWAFVHALGHYVSDHSIYDNLIHRCETYNVPLMAHILFRPDSYPNIDEQFLLLNLQVWADLDYPKLEEQPGEYRFETQQVVGSEENIHDDYTPLWIKALDNKKSYYSYARLFGMQLVQTMLENNYVIHNFDQQTRNSKTYLYPNSNYQQLNDFFQTGNLTWQHTPEFARIVTDELETLEKSIYILNSESVYQLADPYGPIDHLVGVASGFKSVFLLNNLGFSKHTVVSYVDISEPALNYQRFLIDHWDGNFSNMFDVVEQFRQQNYSKNYTYKIWGIWDEEIDKMLDNASLSRSQFAELWQQYKNLDHRFYHANLLHDYVRLVDIVQKEQLKNNYIWVSNAFEMQWLVFLHGSVKHRIEKDLVQRLNDADINYCLESSGYFWYSETANS